MSWDYDLRQAQGRPPGGWSLGNRNDEQQEDLGEGCSYSWRTERAVDSVRPPRRRPRPPRPTDTTRSHAITSSSTTGTSRGPVCTCESAKTSTKLHRSSTVSRLSSTDAASPSLRQRRGRRHFALPLAAGLALLAGPLAPVRASPIETLERRQQVESEGVHREYGHHTNVDSASTRRSTSLSSSRRTGDDSSQTGDDHSRSGQSWPPLQGSLTFDSRRDLVGRPDSHEPHAIASARGDHLAIIAQHHEDPSALRLQQYKSKRAHVFAQHTPEGLLDPTYSFSYAGDSAESPKDVVTHYDYVDGTWVPTPDWDLNGRSGATYPYGYSAASEEQGESQAQESLEESQFSPGEVEMGGSGGTGKDVPLADGSHNNTSIAYTTSNSIGPAPTNNAQLGVELDTSTSSAASSTSSASPATTSATSTQKLISTRTNMVSFGTATASPSGTSSGSSGNGTGVRTYDFSHDVPSGWITDSRTAAYAVPVIIGVSVFLAFVIFSLILLLVRSSRRRRTRRKYGMKLQEEGVAAEKNRRRSSRSDDDGDSANDVTCDMSRNARSVNGEVVYDEKTPGRAKRLLIGRKWSPAGTASGLRTNYGLRRRRRNRAKGVGLFNDNRGPIIEEVVEGDPLPSPARAALSRGSSPISIDMSGTELQQRPGQDVNLLFTGSQGLPLARQISAAGTVRSSASSIRSSDALTAEIPSSGAQRPSLSIRIHPPEASTSGAANREMSVEADAHAVPLPPVGPPAYIQPPSPAYTSSPHALPGGRNRTSAAAVRRDDHAGFFDVLAASGFAVDEKRALLSPAAATPAATTYGAPAEGSSSVPSGSNSQSASTSADRLLASQDPWAHQRRFEHLYASRDGEEAEAEQRTGAPSFQGMHGLSAGPSSGSPATNSCVDDPAELAELSGRLQAHIAIDDKEVLSRIREAASAPHLEGSEATASSSSAAVSAGDLADASAPPLVEQFDGEQDAIEASLDASAISFQPGLSGLLPPPPRPPAFTQDPLSLASSSSTFVDEKARLRQAEAQQAANMFHPSSPPSPAHASMPSQESASVTSVLAVPSAPPLSDDAEVTFDTIEGDITPSAPHFDDRASAEASAPDFDVEEEQEDHDGETPRVHVEQHLRPFVEGVV